MDKQDTFSISTALISIVLGLLGLMGIIITPKNANFIVIGIIVVILTVSIINKFNQINENTEKINKLEERFNLETRFDKLEQELYEQKGKLSILKRK